MTHRRPSRRTGPIGLLGAAFLVAVLLLPGAVQPAAHAQNVDPAVYDTLAAAPDGQANFILLLDGRADLAAAAQIADWDARGRAVYAALHGTAVRSQAPLFAARRTGSIPGRIGRFEPLWIANAVVIRGDRRSLDALARQPGVARVLADVKMAPLSFDYAPDGRSAQDAACDCAPSTPLRSAQDAPFLAPDAPATACDPLTAAWGVSRIGAPEVWAEPYNVTGEGTVIGIVDTGVQWDHPALKGQYRGWDAQTGTVDHNYSWYNPAGLCDDSASGTCNADYPFGPPYPDGHGTHVTGIAAGWDGDTAHIGVAPGARWIHAAACDTYECPMSAVLVALQWMLAPADLAGAGPDPAKRPHVVNNSWGGFGGSVIYEEAIAALRAAGILPVFAAGNGGAAGCGPLVSPGDNPGAFSVGSVGAPGAWGDSIYSWSSRGSNPFTGGIGPQVVAPGGGGICSSEANGGYGYGSGTSSAAPHVTGAVSLILSAEPDLVGKVEQVEEILRRTAVPLTTAQTCGGAPGTAVPNNTYGWGRIDVKAAVDMVWQAGTLSGVVTDAGTGLPVAGATVAISRLGKTLSQQTAADGSYSFVAGGGSYDMGVSAFGYGSATAPAVSVAQDAVTTQDFSLTVLSTGGIFGVVRDSGGVPVVGATVSLDGAGLAAVTGPGGAYALADAPYGSHVLDVNAAGYAPGQAAVEVDGPAIAVPAIELVPAADYAVRDGGDTCSAEYAWIDATTGGTAHNLADNAFASVALSEPFPSFTFYGASYGTLHVSSNGFVSFGSGHKTWHGVVPFEGAPNNQIIGLGEDLNPENGSQGVIYTQDLGDGRFVIEYHAVEHWPSGDPETFEIILDRSDGSILVQYQVVSWPDFANAGIENADGSRGILYSSPDNPRLAAGLAVKYTPFSGAAPASPCVAIRRDGTAAVLSWPHLPPNTSYQVWRGTSPYFMPVSEGVRVETLPATGEDMAYPAAGGIGNPEQNMFYAVLGGLAGGLSGPSNRVGEFDFRLVAGN